MKRAILPILVVALAGGARAQVQRPAPPPNGCVGQEAVLFNAYALLQGDTLPLYLSACGSPDLTATTGYLVVRGSRPPFGIYLTFPATTDSTQQQFTYQRYTRFQVTQLTLSWVYDGVRWELHDDTDGESGPQTRTVTLLKYSVSFPNSPPLSRPYLPVSGTLMSLEGIVPNAPSSPARQR